MTYIRSCYTHISTCVQQTLYYIMMIVLTCNIQWSYIVLVRSEGTKQIKHTFNVSCIAIYLGEGGESSDIQDSQLISACISHGNGIRKVFTSNHNDRWTVLSYIHWAIWQLTIAYPTCNTIPNHQYFLHNHEMEMTTTTQDHHSPENISTFNSITSCIQKYKNHST